MSTSLVEKTPEAVTVERRRIVALDVARAVAIFGMIIVNYRIAMNAIESGRAG